MSSYEIIIRPVITERSMSFTEGKRYVFEVAPTAGRIEIKNAVEEIFGVKVAKVNTMHMNPKNKRVGSGRPGTTKAWKKAIVQLTEDSKNIEFFEGMV
jgi:large subunit ribosomal protein L23